MKNKKIYIFMILSLLIMSGIDKLNAWEHKDISKKDISENFDESQYVRLSNEDKFFISFAISVPKIVENNIDNLIALKRIEADKRDLKIKEEMEFLNLNEGICVTIGILGKFWTNYKPNIGGIADRIYIENDKGSSYSYKKIIKNITSDNLEDKDSLVLSFPKQVVTSDNKNIHIVIRGIDKNAPLEKQVKVTFPQEVVSYLLK
ncbi:hypothetical protein HY745_15000 [Candidatus Desantisbacteria bacterium]|nr:hypothetical protein [Candidatus Desantisbacteria bacterium]